MKNCEKCQKHIPMTIGIDGIRKSLKNRKFCLECSPYKDHNTRNLRLMQEVETEERKQTRLCTKCGIEKSLTEFYINHKKKKYRCCKACLSQYTIIKHQQLKLRAIEYKGGQCILCGYFKCPRSLTFHHLDEKEKDFTISHDTSRSWEKIRLEIDKCVLLCSNCHGEVHAGITHLPESNLSA